MNAVVARLEAVFNDIAGTRMAGLPICNPAVRVQAVGFREWQGHDLGVLVTPWTISLVLLQGAGAPLAVLPPDVRMSWEFPSGSYEFMGLSEPALGTCQTCSLISPLADIERHEDAVSIAEQVMAELFSTERSDTARDADRKEMMEAARLNGEKVMEKPLSRRDFLRGSFLGM
jgi:[NiFe] hydrogenase assembly HybE family chaperone